MKTRAAVLREMGRSRPYADSEPLVIEEVELDDPGQGEVRVRMAAGGLCHSDLSVIDGLRPRQMPVILGHEAAGIVEAVGLGVTDLKVGDHVVFSYVPLCGGCVPCLSGRPYLCEPGRRANLNGTLLSGARRLRDGDGALINHFLGISAFSEYSIAAAVSLVKIDSSIPLEKAALFGCAVITGVGAVVNTAQARAGSSIAVFGLGGVGLSAVMGAQLAGCHPIIAVDVLEGKLALARRLGATHAINSQKQDAVAVIKELTEGGAHYAIEAVGSARILAQAYGATREGGKTIAIGLPSPQALLEIPAASIVLEERTLQGSFMGSSVPQRDIPRLLALYKAGKLPVDLIYSREIPLTEINAGFDSLAQGEVVRQVVSFKAR